MATLAPSTIDPLARERRFFLGMSLLLIATALLGFGFFQYAGISSWSAPWWVHVHAFSQMGWLGFFALQNWLVAGGNVPLHRQLGIFGAFYGAWIIAVGLSLGVAEVTSGRYAPGFSAPYSLALNWTNMLTFAALFVAAIAKRKQSDWHKRLMLAAVIVLSLPSMGRILIMLDIASTLNRALFVLSYIVIAMAFDWRNRGALHPAWLWGAGATMVMGSLIGALPRFEPFASFATSLAP